MRGGNNSLMTAAETADLLGCHVETLYLRWREWGLSGHRIGRKIMFRSRDVENWIDKQ